MPKALVMCALQVEAIAVLSHLSGTAGQTTPTGTRVEVGQVELGNAIWDIGVVECGPGNNQTAVITQDAMGHYRPDVALFVGVAGGIKDVAIGDVVAATKIYGYHSGKAGTEFQARPDLARSSHPLVQAARTVAQSQNWHKRAVHATSCTSIPHAIVQPIAAGEQVVADKRSVTYSLIREYCGDTTAVEMEGKGFLEAAFLHNSVPSIVIRGISDLIDEKTAADGAGGQVLASAHAAAFALELLATVQLPAASKGDQELNGREAMKPNVFNVPYHRNPTFVGHESTLAKIRTSGLEGAGFVNAHWLHGMSGIGKSHLAVEQCYRAREEFDIVLWTSAADGFTHVREIAALSNVVDVSPAPGAEPSETAKAVLDAIDRSEARMLLVFDDVRDYSMVSPYIPKGKSHLVLMTAQGRCAHPKSTRFSFPN